MSRKLRHLTTGLLLFASTSTVALAQAPRQPIPNTLEQPVYRVAASAKTTQAQTLVEKYPNHPWAPLLTWAYREIDNVRAIKDYSATIVKRELVDGEIVGPQYIFVKVRHEPFSVYTYFLSPPDLKGQEAIWVKDQNEGKLVAHPPRHTILGKTIPFVKLDPISKIAMRGNRYPITNTGFVYLIEELIRNGEHDIQYGECEVQTFKGAKINGRTCTVLQITHPVPRSNFRFHLARIFVDDELQLPIRYASYDWPKKEGDAPGLLEEYTYLNVKLNNGFGDQDFDMNNPEYSYKK